MLFPEDKKIDLSISIVSYNVKDLLAECIQSIIEHTKGIKYEIIVVDNCSRDGTADMLAKKFPKVKVLQNPKNRGFAAAMNRGLSMGRGRYLFSLDSDTYIKEDTFSDMVRFMDQCPDAGAAGAKLLSPQGASQYSRRRFPPSLWPVIYRGSILKKILPPTKQVRHYEMSDVVLTTESEVDWVYGGNIIFNRRALEQVGLFDERFFIYCEDIDLSYRMEEHGWKRYFVPGTRIFHYGQQGTKQIKIRSYLRHVVSYTKLFHKYNWRLDEKYQCNFKRGRQSSKVLFVLINDNQKELLSKCLEVVQQNLAGLDARILVVDESSCDGSIEMLKKDHPHVLWIANNNRNCFSDSFNRIYRMNESEYLVIVPLDAKAIFGQFAELHAYLEKRSNAGMAAIVNRSQMKGLSGKCRVSEKEMFFRNCVMIKRNALAQARRKERHGISRTGEVDICSEIRRAGFGVYYLIEGTGSYACKA
jgi:GT2 family glycosyltransferase